MLKDPLKQAILGAYHAIGKANQHISALMPHQIKSEAWAGARNRAQQSVAAVKEPIEGARNELLEFLRSEHPGD